MKDGSEGERVDLQDLKRKSIRGGVVSVFSTGIAIVVQLASTVVLGRLLSPEEYGIMAMVMAVTAFAGLFRDFGLSSASIQQKELSQAQQSNLFWLNTAVGAVLTLGLMATSPLVAGFYGKPGVRDVSLLLSFNFLIGSLGTQCGVTLLRKLEFGKKAGAEIAGSIMGLAVSIVLALNGLGYWALAWGAVVSAMATTTFLFLVSGFRPGLPQQEKGMRAMLRFGISITTFDFINYFHRNVDNILVGRFCGTEALGYYSRAYSLLMLPITAIRNPILSVGFPAMSRLQNEPENFRAYYLRLVRLMALGAMPLTAFLFIGARPIVHLALGTKWDPICPIFALLAAVAFVQPVITLWAIVVQSRGLGKRYVQMGMFNACCSVVGFGIGLRWGPVGVAAGYVVATYLSAVPLLYLAYEGTALRLLDFFENIASPAIASFVASVLGALALSYASGVGLRSFWVLFASGVVFLPTYVVVLRLLPEGEKDLNVIWEFVQKKIRAITE